MGQPSDEEVIVIEQTVPASQETLEADYTEAVVPAHARPSAPEASDGYDRRPPPGGPRLFQKCWPSDHRKRSDCHAKDPCKLPQ